MWRQRVGSSLPHGVIALGSVVELCKHESRVRHPEFLASDKWKGNMRDELRWKTGIVIEAVRLTPQAGMITAGDLKALLPQLEILRQPQGTVWPIKDQRATGVLNTLWKLRNKNKKQKLHMKGDVVQQSQSYAEASHEPAEMTVTSNRLGYNVESVTAPDALYAIADPARVGLLKIGCGTFADRQSDGNLGCQARLAQAKLWTAGEAYFAVLPTLIGPGIGKIAENFVHNELRKRGCFIHGEWFKASPDEVRRLFVRAITVLVR